MIEPADVRPSAGALRCAGVSVRFGSFAALSDVGLDFEAGRTTALIGPNGAGKTTLLNAICGLQSLTSGRIHLDGKPVDSLPVYRRAESGIARSFQLLTIFPDFTVAENLRLALSKARVRTSAYWKPVAGDRSLARAVEQQLVFLGLAEVAQQRAGTLSHGAQRALELGLSLATNPRVLLLDEPLAGVGQYEMGAFADIVRKACAGRTVVLVEHNMQLVTSIADRVAVLGGGRVVATGTVDEIRNDERVRSAYLGDGEC